MMGVIYLMLYAGVTPIMWAKQLENFVRELAIYTILAVIKITTEGVGFIPDFIAPDHPLSFSLPLPICSLPIPHFVTVFYNKQKLLLILTVCLS